MTGSLERLGVVVHPTRDIDRALATLRRWSEAHGVELLQLPTPETERQVAPPGEVHMCDLVVAVGGDGTVLAALRAAAATKTPVLGVACGSLGALSAVTADELAEALDRYRRGDWTARPVPLLDVAGLGAVDDFAVNDFVVNRRGSGQVAADLLVDGERYVRVAGDGLIIATPLGSSAYSMAAGGPILAAETGFVCTPLAMHGGSGPPVVVPASATVTIVVHPSYAGFDAEVDGHRRETDSHEFTITMRDERLRLVSLDPTGHGLGALRRRGLVTDSPRMLARDDRSAARPRP